MISAWSYVAGVLTLAVVAAAALAFAAAVRRTLVPDWAGAPARLAVAVAAISFVALLAELLGSVGGFRRWPLLAVSAVVGVAAARRANVRLRRRPCRGLQPGAEGAVAAGLVALALEPWLQAVRIASRDGITEVDSLWYHLPAAAGFAQSGRVTTLRYFGDSAHSFLPWTSELFHAVGMVAFHADLLSLVLNLAWAALALLAAWCIGRPYRCSPAAVVACALVLALPVMATSQPATAKNDTAGLALLLASVALLLPGAASSRAVVLAGAAAGLAAGTRLNLLVPVLVLTASVVLAAAPSRRLASAVLWTAGLLATGSFWYIRNAAIAHNPVPWFRIGIGSVALPAASGPSSDCGDPRLTERLSSSAGLRTVTAALHQSLGSGWILVLALAALGVVLTVGRGTDRRPLLLLAVPAVVAAATYAVTPGTGTVRVGCMAYDVRFLTPSLALGLIALVVVAAGAARLAAGALLAVAVLLTVPTPLTKLPVAVAVALVTLAVPVVARRRLLAPCAAGAIAVAVIAGFPLGRRYLDDRYTHGGSFVENITPGYLLLRTQPAARVAVDGFGETYLFYGARLQHHVEIAVRRGPHGTFARIDSSGEWQRWLERRAFDYVVLPEPGGRPAAWTAALAGAERIAVPETVVYRLPTVSR